MNLNEPLSPFIFSVFSGPLDFEKRGFIDTDLNFPNTFSLVLITYAT